MGKHHRIALALAFLLASSLSAAVTVTSVSPSTGSTAGGTEVIIRGTEFSEIIGSPMLPPVVVFGQTHATNVQLIDETTIRAVTPPHPAGTVHVAVGAQNGSGVLPNAFTFLPDPQGDDHFERILLPLLLPPVNGAFGSEWHTELWLNSSRTDRADVSIYGLYPPDCRQIILCAPPDPLLPFRLPLNYAGPANVEKNGTPGRFVYVPDSQLERLSMNLRIRDVSRDAENFGTEIPIVTEREFKAGKIVLQGVPLDPRFRNTLRIYGHINWAMRVTVGKEPPVDLMMQPGRDQYEPAYAVFTQFPVGTGTVNVTIEPTPNMLPVVPPPFWAFIAVTNNTTQMVTTITPEP